MYIMCIFASSNMFKPSSNQFLMTAARRYFFCGPFLLFVFHVCYVVLSVHCGLVVTCWERAEIMTLLFVMFSCVMSLFHMMSCAGMVFDYIDS